MRQGTPIIEMFPIICTNNELSEVHTMLKTWSEIVDIEQQTRLQSTDVGISFQNMLRGWELGGK